MCSARTLHLRDAAGQVHAVYILQDISTIQYDPYSCQSTGNCFLQASYVGHAHPVCICFHGPGIYLTN